MIVVHDLTGKGSGARCRAVLDACGGVCRVVVDCPGEEYSDDVEVRFYTHCHAFHKDAQPITYVAEEPSVATTQNVRLTMSLDTSARDIDFVIEAESRFLPYLQPGSCDQPIHPALQHVSRYSAPMTVRMHSLGSPHKPDVDYLMHSFTWKVHAPKAIEPDDVTDYFRGRPRGELRLERQANVRIYLHRPWHVRGEEQLAVLVLPATLNTVRDKGDVALKKNADAGVDNPVDRLNDTIVAQIKPPFLAYERAYIPPLYRKAVSVWGYDPEYSETPLPPLQLSHLPLRDRKIRVIVAQEMVPSAKKKVKASQADDMRRVCLALHDVQYDAGKDAGSLM